MLVTLYTSRIVLEELGVDDYGVYMVVAGVVSMFGFLNGSMASSTQRYLNYELGSDDYKLKRLKLVFSTSLTIHLFIGVCILVMAETIGLWFVNTKLVIPSVSKAGANIVYQCAILSFIINILRVPYNAAIIAHEKMNIYAIVSIIEAVLLLGVAFLLKIVISNKLSIYGLLVLGIQIIIALTYLIITTKKFPECTIKFSYTSDLLKEMSKFAGWNLFGSIAWLIRGQGMGILLNIFYGPVLNAAKGVAEQVSGAVNSLTNNFQTALNPQITKCYASGEIKSMELLSFRGIKFSSFLMWLIALPVITNVSTILSLWLKEVPSYAAIFVVLILCDSLCSILFGNPLMASLSATGKIKKYQIIVSLVLLLILPFAYIALKDGYPPESIFYLNIFFNLLGGITRFWFCKIQISYSWKIYFKYVLFPLFIVVILSLIIPLSYKFFLSPILKLGEILTLFIQVLLSIVSVGICVWFIGLTSGEKSALSKMIVKKIQLSK